MQIKREMENGNFIAIILARADNLSQRYSMATITLEDFRLIVVEIL